MPTVFSIVRRPDLTPWVGKILFRPSKSPWFRYPDVVADVDIQVYTDETGYFSQDLASGYYWCWLGTSDPFVIIVPETDETYLLGDLRKGGAGTPSGLLSAGTNYRIEDGTLQLVNGTTGDWHPIWLVNTDGDDRLAIGAAGAETSDDNYQVSGDTLLLKNFSTSAWQPPFIEGTSPAFQLAVGAAGELPDNFRTLSGALQWANPATGKWHTIFIIGTSGVEQLAIGPETT